MAKTKSRGNGDGTIYKSEKRGWVGQITLGKGVDGRLIRKTAYAKTRAGVKEKLEKSRDLTKIKYEEDCAIYTMEAKRECDKVTTRKGKLNRFCQFVVWKILLFCTKKRRIRLFA